VKGIGLKTKEALMKALKSLKRVQESDVQTLTDIVGEKKAMIIYNYFHQKDGQIK
jgi:excinuclease ABC subunit C